MAGKSTEGFTKSAQKIKFVRNRDIKLKDSEIKKEQKICKLMAEGICQKCREKAQWRFKYDKYKPLKSVANCQGCKQKCVTKAYRTLCDKCAISKKVCPSCCKDFVAEEELAMDVETNTNDNNGTNKTKESKASKKLKVNDDEDGEDDYDDEMDDDDEDEDVDENEVNNNSIPTGDIQTLGMETIWDERKFQNIAASKYSKNRVIGNETDTMN